MLLPENMGKMKNIPSMKPESADALFTFICRFVLPIIAVYALYSSPALTERRGMRNAEQIAEIAQSEPIWTLFVGSELFVHAAPNADVLSEAQAILERQLNRLDDNHPERGRKERALERLRQKIRSYTSEAAPQTGEV